MTEKPETDASFMGSANLFSSLLGPMMNNWTEMFTSSAAQPAAGPQGRMGESIQATAKMWQAMLGAMSEPEALENFKAATQITPDIALGFAQTCLKGFLGFQEKLHEWIEKRGQAEDTFDAQALDKEFIRQWTAAYEKEFSQYLKIPQIGLGRLYQERAMQAADKLNMFQGTLSEFMHALYLPMEKAFKSLQEKMVEMAEAGPLDEKSKTYYNLWIKMLEGHYMELFKQQDFVDRLGKTLCALEEYSAARQAVVNDFLKMYAIPTHNDLDDLYKEIYLLKKRMRAYEKKNGA